MGTDPDLCSRGLEDEVDKALLHMAMEKLTDREADDCGTALRSKR